jgi:hypothetical protein
LNLPGPSFDYHPVEDFIVPDSKKLAAECRRKSAEARHMAKAASSAAEKADLLKVERRWLRLARDHESRIRAPSSRKPHRKNRD